MLIQIGIELTVASTETGEGLRALLIQIGIEHFTTAEIQQIV